MRYLLQDKCTFNISASKGISHLLSWFLRWCLLSTLLLTISGCADNSGLYLHDAARQKTSEEAKAFFDEFLKKGSAAKMVASYDDQRMAETELRNLIREADTRLQIDTLPDVLFSDLKEETETEQKITHSALFTAKKDKRRTEATLKKFLEKLPLAKKDTQSFLEAINEAERAKARLQASQKVLRATMIGLIESQAEMTAEKKEQHAKVYLDRVKTLFKEDIEYTSYMSIDGNLIKNQESEKTSIARLLGLTHVPVSSRDDAFKPLLIKMGQQTAMSNLLEDPGALITLLGLSYDFAYAEEHRIQAETGYAKTVIPQYDAYIKFLKQHKNDLFLDLEKTEGIGALIKNIQQDADKTVAQNLVFHSKKCQQSDNAQSNECQTIREAYILLQLNFDHRVINPKQREDFELRISALKVKRDLEIAGVNLREREAAISRGLEGVVEFYRGGINEDDVRNIIGVVQALGLFAIANEV